MLGLPCEEWKRSQHMLTAPSRGYAIITAAADGSSSSSHSANSFSKDGRKISVGDCALFKPPQDCPPFIGIIRFFSVGNDNKLNLVVNWLYRPAEVKLGKGVLLEATPNEIFYSFHKDEIPAASLLHPCKVAFLPKGVELPSGTSSFVCRRVYDITNKCLWWLTDQDYINEHQEEVNHLLHKTQVEMHAAAQPGGRSPKPMNSTSSASPLKTSSDNVQNSTTCIPSQVKGKKRERVDHSSEHGKRERTIKTDDLDSGPRRQGSILKVEMEKITDKGGLIDSVGVEKLVQLMVPDKSEKKLDLAGQAILAGVIAATDNHDCLSQFVQVKGLLVFDEWLQDVHRGKFGDLSGPKDSDKSVEEFLLVLLRALDKLPVNLQALQMCNIGKSVNRLRSHKNVEIQKKARGLVDTWKKRVEAEMNVNDAKSGLDQGVSWPVRPRLLEVSQGGSKQSGGSSEVAIKSSVSQLSSSKLVSSKTYQVESISKQVSAAPASASSPGSLILLPPPPASADVNAKERQPQSVNLAGASDLPIATERDEKISGSSQSHSTSQSFSGEQTKSVGFPGKEDGRSSTCASVIVNKMSGSSSRHRKLSNGVPALNSSAVLREIGTTTKSSIKKKTVSAKLSQSGVVAQKTPEGIAFEGSSNKLIVKIPNHGRNPAQDAGSGSPGDPLVINSRGSSACLAERPKPSDQSLSENTDFKCVQTGTDEGDRSHAVVSDDSKMIAAVQKDASSSFGNENNTLNLQDASFSSMNALIESCVKYSEADATLSALDDAGMNLLASVAAGEFSKSCLVTPIRSPQSNGTIVEESGVGRNTEAKYPNGDGHDHNHPGDSDDNKHSKSNEVCRDLGAADVDGSFAALVFEEKLDGEKDKHFNNAGHKLQQTKENFLDREIVGEKPPDASFPVLPGGAKDEVISTGDAEQWCETNVVGKSEGGNFDGKQIIGCSTLKVEMDPTLNTNMEVDVKEKKCSLDILTTDSQTEATPVDLQFQSAQGGDKQVSFNSCHGMGKISDDVELKVDKSKHFKTNTSVANAECQKPKEEENIVIFTNIRVLGNEGSEIPGQDAEDIGDNLANKEADGPQDDQILHSNSPANQSKESEQVVDSKESKLIATEAEDAGECSSTTADASSRSAAGISDGVMAGFDLNEGLNADEGKCLDMDSTSPPGHSNPVQFISTVPFSASGFSNNVSTSVTVAAAAKGRFLPPEDLLKNKVELGWKGSAATSAFRPAEPRKSMEMSLYPSSMPLSDVRAGKQSRPLLDIDLNIADERMLEDVAPQSSTRKDDCILLSKVVHEPEDKVSASGPGWCYGRVDLDLNQTDETPELGNCLASSSHRIDEPVMHSVPSLSTPGSSGMNVHRDFDLNNGPAIDEINFDSLVHNQHARISVQSQQPIPGFRMSNSELGNFSPWFPSTGNTYSAVSSSIMTDRGDQPFPVGAAFVPQRVSGPSSSGSPFGADVYRGPILSSSPAVPFSSRGFQYPVFHVGSSFPVPSTSLTGGSANFVDPSCGGRLNFPAANPQLLGTAATVPSYYPRPYVVCIPDSSNCNSPESSRKWTRQGLDLNAGPGGADGEGRNDSVPLTLRQHSVGSSQSLAEEHARMFQMSGSILKRKEPEGGWDGFKQSSWQ